MNYWKQMHVYSERVFEIVNMGDMEHRKYLPMIPSEMLNYKVIIPLSVTFQVRDSQIWRLTETELILLRGDLFIDLLSEWEMGRGTLVKVLLLLIAINDRVRNGFKNIKSGFGVGTQPLGSVRDSSKHSKYKNIECWYHFKAKEETV